MPRAQVLHGGGGVLPRAFLPRLETRCDLASWRDEGGVAREGVAGSFAGFGVWREGCAASDDEKDVS